MYSSGSKRSCLFNLRVFPHDQTSIQRHFLPGADRDKWFLLGSVFHSYLGTIRLIRCKTRYFTCSTVTVEFYMLTVSLLRKHDDLLFKQLEINIQKRDELED